MSGRDDQSSGSRRGSSRRGSSLEGDSSGPEKSIWDRYIIQRSTFATSSSGASDNFGRLRRVAAFFQDIYTEVGFKVVVVIQHPGIWVTGLFCLALLLGTSVGTLWAWSANSSDTKLMVALGKAEEITTLLSHKLDVALLPLIAMQDWVTYWPAFRDLSRQVGQRGEPGSAPAENGPRAATHRNMTGVLDAGAVDLFHAIAADIRLQKGLKDLILNIQLAPMGVKALIDPVFDSSTCSDGTVLTQDNRRNIGLDLVKDAGSITIAKATLRASGVVTTGPLLRPKTYMVTKGLEKPENVSTFVARLPINLPGQSLRLQGKEYGCWGWVTVVLNWDKLLDVVGVYTRFEREGLLFELLRSNRISPGRRSDQNTESGHFASTVIAGSKELLGSGEWGEKQSLTDNLTFSLNTTDHVWTMTVGYKDGFTVLWIRWTVPLFSVASLIFCTLIMFALASRQQHLQLLYKMMPRQAIAKLKKGESVVEKYDDVSVYFSDIIGFTSMAGEMTPIQVMAMLNDLYTQFDELVDKYNVYKVETIGGAYMVLGGAPNVCPPAEGAEKVYIRCGIASGPVVAGVVGRAMPRYCLFGDTVNFASRMESTSKRMQIQISELTYYLLRNAPNHKFKMGMRRGPDGSAGVEVKGKGRVMTYWIDGIEEAT